MSCLWSGPITKLSLCKTHSAESKMSASSTNESSRTNLCANNVTSQLAAARLQTAAELQRANGTESMPANGTPLDSGEAQSGPEDLAREESRTVGRAQDSTNELYDQSFPAQMSTPQVGANRQTLDEFGHTHTNNTSNHMNDAPPREASGNQSVSQAASNVYGGSARDPDESLEDEHHTIDPTSHSTDNKHIEYDDDADADDTSTSASANSQLVELNSLSTPRSNLDLNRRAGQEGNLLSALGAPLTNELRRLRQSGVKKVQEALEHNRRRRGRRKPSSHHKKRATTGLPVALIKSMQTRQGLMSSGASGVASSGGLLQASGAATSQQQAYMSPLMKQLAATNPLKQQLSSSSIQISTAIQRLLATKFGSAAAAAAANSNNIHNNNQTQTTRPANELMIHNDNNHLFASGLDEDQAGGDYSATSATSASEQLNNLLAASQRDPSSSASGQSLAGLTGNQYAHFLDDMQTHHGLQRPPSPSLGALEDDAAPPPIHRPGHSLADYQGSASTQADRLAELIGQWNGQRRQRQHPQPSSPIDTGHQQDGTLKLSQLVAAASAAAAAASGQSNPPTVTNKQLIPIEIIGLDPSVTNSILYGPGGQQQQPRPLKQAELPDETSGGGASGPAAANQLDLQQNPQHFQAPLRHHRHPIEQTALFADNSQTGADSSHSQESAGEQPTAETQTSREKVSRQAPSSVLHIHHFHHTQPAASGLAEQQSGPDAGAANSESGETVESGAEQQPSGESGKESETSSQTGEEIAVAQRPAASKVSRASTIGEAPRPVLVSGTGSGAAQSQESAPGELKQVSAWSHEAGDQQSQLSENQIEGAPSAPSGEDESETPRAPGAPAPIHPKRMRFVTRNSLRLRQQQQQQQQPTGYQNLTYANSHSHGGAHSPPSQFNSEQQQEQQQQYVFNSQQNQLRRPVIIRGENQRQAGGYNAMLLHQPSAAHFRGLLSSAGDQTDLQQALGDAPDSQGMLMVAYRPTGTLVSTGGDGQVIAPFYGHTSYNHSHPPATLGQHNIYTSQGPYNEGSESKTPGQLLVQRPHTNSSQLLLRPQLSSRAPSPNLLKSLMKYPKMNEALLVQQLHSSNQSASPYWSNEDERLLAQFNLANAPGQLKVAPANLIQASNTSLDGYPNQFSDSLSLMSRLNYTLGSSPQSMQQLQLASGLGQGNSSQRVTSDELAQVLREQASKQLRHQNQIKQQQQSQVASLLLNNLAAAGSQPASSNLLDKIAGLTGNGSSSDATGFNQLQAAKSGRFELTMASDRSPIKFPVSRNASMVNNSHRMTKHFHGPEASLHDKESGKMPENSVEQHPAKVAAAGGSLEPQLHVQASRPSHTGPKGVVVENILDSAHGLDSLALGFIFFVSLMTFILILASLIYRRRRAIGSARCGPSTNGHDDSTHCSSQLRGSAHENGGRKSLRCLNNLTQRTKYLMRSNFSGSNSTSNVIAGSTPLSSLKSLNQLDSSITSDSQNQHAQAEHHRAAPKKAASPQLLKQGTDQFLESSNNKSRHARESQHSLRANGLARSSKYSCPSQHGATPHTKVSTLDVSSRLINGAHHSGIDKYSTPDDTDRATFGEHSNAGIRTLNTRFHKNAYLQKTVAASATTASHEHVRLSTSHQASGALGKKHQQYNRASPGSIEMPQSQAKYVNTQEQLKNANL